MDDDRRVELQPEPVGTPQRRVPVWLAITLIIGALLVGILRPWDLLPGPLATDRGTSASTGGPEVPAVSSVAAGRGLPSPTPDDPYAALWTTCGSPSGWRSATIQQWAGRAGPVRSWIAIDPVEATGPLDPGIPFAPVATDVVTALGYCSPLADDLRPPLSAAMMLWTLTGGAPMPIAGRLVEPAGPSALGGLWQPPPGIAVTIDGFAAWPPGRYVMEIRSPGGTFDRWLGLEIEDLRARATPGTRPGPSAPPGPGDGATLSPATGEPAVGSGPPP